MPTKPKHLYNIETIETLENKNPGISIREIARRNGWPEGGTQQWINRNFKKQVKYVPK